MMRCLLAVLAILALAFTQAVAQNKSEEPSLAGAKIFIEPMRGELHPFIAVEIVKKKLPFVVVTDKDKAQYILAGSFRKGDDKWYHKTFGVTNKNEGGVQLINVKNKRLVWAGEAGDRSLPLGGWSRGGQLKVADRIVNKMKKDLFSQGNTNPYTGKRRTKTPRS